MAVQIQQRHDIAAAWTSVNPVLAEGEVGWETDTRKYKLGDGVTAWTALAYVSAGGVADGDKGDITVTGSGSAWAIDAGAVNYAKIQNVSTTQRLLGRNSAGAGTVQEVTFSQLLDWVGSAATGDVLYRDASGWNRLAVGSNGQVLTVASGVPAWVNASSGGMTNPMTTAGDIIIGGVSGAPARLGLGSAGQVLGIVSGAPAWVAAGSGSPGGATTQVQYNNAGSFAGDATYTFDATTKALSANKVNTIKGANIARAATTSIGAATGNFVSLTGTTTINSFGTGTAGWIRILHFAGAGILTHNATSLILPGGVSITTGAGDTAIAVSEGGSNWRVVSYNRANGQPVATAQFTSITVLAPNIIFASGTQDIDMSLGGVHQYKLTGNCTFNFINWPAGASSDGKAAFATLLVDPNGFTATLPAYYSSGPLPTLTSGQYTAVRYIRFNGDVYPG